jgi:hypothetical protein
MPSVISMMFRRYQAATEKGATSAQGQNLKESSKTLAEGKTGRYQPKASL